MSNISKPAKSKMISAMKEITEPPCEKYLCPMVERCKAESLACKSFRFYVESGASASPKFDGIKKDQITYSEIINPTRKIYQHIFSG